MFSLSPMLDRLRAGLPVAGMRARTGGGDFAGAAFVACVPARDEAGRIERCLAALDAELEPGDGVVLVANGCGDATAAIAERVMAGWRRPFALLDLQWRPGSGSAPLARRLALDLGHALSPAAALLSVDGDTVAMPGLRAAYRHEFALGFALVCGRIGFLPEEAALLPPSDPGRDALVRRYRDASREIAARILPDPDNPWPHHGNIGGANFAISGPAYALAGPLPTPPSGEDRALRRRCEALALRIRYSDAPRVLTSCRLDGRASGGLADELRRDRFEADPVVDELLEPAGRLLRRLRARRDFLGAPDAPARESLLRRLGLGEEDARRLAAAGGGLAWLEAEDLSPRLRRTRLRASDLRAHLPALLQALAAIPPAPCGSAPFPERRAS